MELRAENYDFKIGTTTKLSIDSSGNADFAGNIKLSGNGTSNDSYPITFTNGACAIARDGNDLELHAYDNMVFGVSNTSYPTSTERMRITSAGSVVIGNNPTPTSGCLLTLRTSASTGLSIKSGSNQGESFINFGDGDDVNPGQIYYGHTDDKMIFRTNDVARMTINSSGNVGIGTSSPQQRLTVGDGSGSEIISIYAGNTNASAVHFTDTNTSTDYQGFVSYNHSSDALRFGTAEAERMRINSSGNVGIGTSSPATFLQVSGQGNRAGGNIQMGVSSQGANKWSYLTGTHYNSTTEPEGFALIGGYSDIDENRVVIGGDIWETNPATSIHFWTHNSSTHEQGGTQKMVINSAGNVGIGTSSPAEKLSLPDNAKIGLGNSADLQIYHDGSNSFITENNTGGSLIIRGSNFAVQSSDGTDDFITTVANQGVKLFYNDVEKFETTSTGVTVTGDLEIENSSDGIILESPDGTRYRVTVANGGTLSVSAV